MRILKFEEIKAWQLARELVKKIYGLSEQKEFSRDFGFRDQIRRASVSIMSNIAEGFERYSNNEFVQYLVVAKGSAGEVRSQLYIALDLKYISAGQFSELKDLCEIISRQLSNLIKYLKNNKPLKEPS